MADLGYYDPKRQQIDTEHARCVVEEGERWFGHGMLCRRPELHAAPGVQAPSNPSTKENDQ